MIGWVTVAGITLPVYEKTWIKVPPTVSPTDLLAVAQASLYVPALEVLPVEELVQWAALRGLCDYSCRDPELQKHLVQVLRRDYEDVPLMGRLRAVPATAGSLHPGPAEAALEAYAGLPSMNKDEVLVAPEPGAQIELALMLAPLRRPGHLCVLHYRPPTHPQAWLQVPYTKDAGSICAAFGDSDAFDAVYRHYETRGEIE